jgi:hypothetical protein
MHYIDQFYSGLISPHPTRVSEHLKFHLQGACLMLTVIYILKTNPQYVQKSVKSHKTTCKNIQNTVKIVRCVQLSIGM